MFKPKLNHFQLQAVKYDKTIIQLNIPFHQSDEVRRLILKWQESDEYDYIFLNRGARQYGWRCVACNDLIADEEPPVSKWVPLPTRHLKRYFTF